MTDFLEHFGVKGMKWGVRKGGDGPKAPKGGKLVLEKTFKTGDQVAIYETPPPAFGKLMIKMSGRDIASFKSFQLRDKDGTKVGDASFERKSKDELYLNWIGIKTKHRGKGYASAALKGALQYAQNEGVKKLTLEVPGNAPDAKHIYTKLGFKESGSMVGDAKSDPVWGGLQPMEMKVPSKKVNHATEDVDQWEQDFADEFAAYLIENFGTGGDMAQSFSSADDFLAHYGVKGMKWGRRKATVPASAESATATAIRAKAKTGKTASLTNAELRAAIDRMQLEQNFKRLAVNEKPAVTRFISSTLMEIGKREVQQALARKVAKTVAKKVATGGAA